MMHRMRKQLEINPKNFGAHKKSIKFLVPRGVKVGFPETNF